MNDWQDEALKLIQAAAHLAQTSRNRKIAEATINAVNAMADDGLVSSVNVQPYAMVMNELIQSGALRIRPTAPVAATDLVH